MTILFNIRFMYVKYRHIRRIYVCAARALDNALTECLLKQVAASQVHAVITPVSISLFETRAGK